MTETRRRRAPKSAPAPEPVETPAEVVDAPTPAPEPEPYRTGRWHGHENYQCALCAFATLSRVLIDDHVRTAHPAGRR